jgi:hypothetical protein
MKQYRTKAFLDLRDEWYERLRAEGFEDIENTKTHTPILKQYHAAYFSSRYSAEEFQEILSYYETAQSLSLKGESFLDAQVWRYHSQGMLQPEIGKRVNRSTARVNQIIQRFRKRFVK